MLLATHPVAEVLVRWDAISHDADQLPVVNKSVCVADGGHSSGVVYLEDELLGLIKGDLPNGVARWIVRKKQK